jgi:glycosyltransferase involved in cell wall biosynthesis
MGKNFVSIIIPVKNCKENIENLINSLKNQTFKNFEVVIVSSSKKDYHSVKKFKGVKLIKVPSNWNANMARNVGIRKSRGKIIAFIDCDGIADENWLKNIVGYYDSDEVMCVAGSVLELRDTVISDYLATTLFQPSPVYKKKIVIDKNNFHKTRYPIGCNLTFRKEIFNKVGYLDEKIHRYEEIEFLWRFLEKGYKILCVPQANVWHKHGHNFFTLFKRYFKDGRGCGEFCKKYPNSQFAIKRFSLLIFWLVYITTIIHSLLTSFEIIFFLLIPLLPLFLYYVRIALRDKKPKVILYPILDCLFCGIAYPLGMIRGFL